VPSEPHVIGFFVVASHSEVPGEQEPTHAPSTHAWLVHVTGLLHVPVALHVSYSVLLVHCAEPGVHSPPQTSPSHTNWHGAGLPHELAARLRA